MYNLLAFTNGEIAIQAKFLFVKFFIKIKPLCVADLSLLLDKVETPSLKSFYGLLKYNKPTDWIKLRKQCDKNSIWLYSCLALSIERNLKIKLFRSSVAYFLANLIIKSNDIEELFQILATLNGLLIHIDGKLYSDFSSRLDSGKEQSLIGEGKYIETIIIQIATLLKSNIQYINGQTITVANFQQILNFTQLNMLLKPSLTKHLYLLSGLSIDEEKEDNLQIADSQIEHIIESVKKHINKYFKKELELDEILSVETYKKLKTIFLPYVWENSKDTIMYRWLLDNMREKPNV